MIRYKKVETTLRYDHVSDDMVREYFEKCHFVFQTTDVPLDDRKKQDSEFGYA